MKELIKQWKDLYKLELAIKDHIRELDEKDKHMKAVDVSTLFDKVIYSYDGEGDPIYCSEEDRLNNSYTKELTDLKILLDMYFELKDLSYLYEERIEKFLGSDK